MTGRYLVMPRGINVGTRNRVPIRPRVPNSELLGLRT